GGSAGITSGATLDESRPAGGTVHSAPSPDYAGPPCGGSPVLPYALDPLKDSARRGRRAPTAIRSSASGGGAFTSEPGCPEHPHERTGRAARWTRTAPPRPSTPGTSARRAPLHA